MIEAAYYYLFFISLIIIAAIILVALIKTIVGKLTVDKIIGINMIGTLTVICIVILTALLKEDYVADIAIIYVMLSFITVLILSKIYINLFALKLKNKKDEEEDSHD